MELENIVANTVLLKAREGKDGALTAREGGAGSARAGQGGGPPLRSGRAPGFRPGSSGGLQVT